MKNKSVEYASRNGLNLIIYASFIHKSVHATAGYRKTLPYRTTQARLLAKYLQLCSLLPPRLLLLIS